MLRPGTVGPELGTLNTEPAWRFMGSHMYGDKSPNMGYNYSYLTYNLTYNYPSRRGQKATFIR